MQETIFTACEGMAAFPLKYTNVDSELFTREYATSTAFRPLELQKFSNVVASYSPSGVFHTDGPVIPESLLPQYLHAGSMDRSIAARLKPVSGEYVFMGHIIGHYGHFFVEALSRFWALGNDILKGKKLVYLFNPSLTFYNRENSPFVSEFFRFAGIDEGDIKFVFEPELFETLYVPTPAISKEFTIHPYRKKEMARIADILRRRNPTFVPPARVYFSRKGLPVSTRFIINEEDVENVHRSFGFSIIQPHALELEEEILSFSNIDVASCLHCSAINNAMFSPNVKTGIIIYDDYVNYGEPRMMHIVSSIIDNVYSLSGVVEPLYKFNDNVFWYTPACKVNIDLLRKQLSFVLKEKPSKIHSIKFEMDNSAKADIYANISSSLTHFGLSDEAGLFLQIAKSKNPNRPFVKEMNHLLRKLQQSSSIELPLTNRCFTVKASQYDFVEEDVRLFAEDGEYFNQYAKFADMLAMLIPRYDFKNIVVPEYAHRRLSSYGVALDGIINTSKVYDLITIDGTQGYQKVRGEVDVALGHLAERGVIAVCSVLPFDNEYYPRLVSNLVQYREFQHKLTLDSWKIVYDVAHNLAGVAYATVNIDDGVLLIVKNGAVGNRNAIGLDDIEAMWPELPPDVDIDFFRLAPAIHLYCLLRHVSPGGEAESLASVVGALSCATKRFGDFFSESNGVKKYIFNKSNAANPATPYRLADLIAFSYRHALGADIGLVGGWEGFASLYVVNNVLVGKPESVLPCNDTLCVFTLTGAELVEVINDAVSQCTPMKNRFYPHVSGMDMRRDEKGFVVVYSIGAECFRPERRYTLVVNSRFANGYPGYQKLAEKTHENTGIPCLQALNAVLSRYDYE